jgi:CO/xanthine dehydrogenase Mo-binding subunit
MLDRRQFLKSSAVIGGGLVIGFNLPGCGKSPFPAAVNGALQPNAFLQLTPDNRLIMQLHKADMGQGVSTGFATLAAEEIGVPPATLEIQFAQVHKDFKDPEMSLMVTGGSNAIKNGFELVRKAGASMRKLLLGAAAKQWTIDAGQLRINEDLTITNLKTNATKPFAAFIDAARSIAVDADPLLKDAAEFKYIGKPGQRVDSRAKVLGKAGFGADTHVENALVAVVVRCPHFGGSVKSFDAAEIQKAKGIRHVVQIGSGVAVVGDKYYLLKKALPLLKVEWNKGPLAGLTSEKITQQQRELLKSPETESIRDDGEFKQLPEDHMLEAEYRLPYLAHATMEPQNAIVSVTDTDCTIWAPNQGPDVAQDTVAAVLKRPRDTIKVNNTWLGGGFGRRITVDYIAEAAEISAAVKAPVRLQWSREDDMQHDIYRPAYMSGMRAFIGKDGTVKSWQHKLVGPSILRQSMPTYVHAAMPQWVPHSAAGMMGDMMKKSDFTSVEGAKELPYSFTNIRVDYTFWDPGIPIGFWRSVGHSHTAFVVESFVDEIAHSVKTDPYEFRLKHIADLPRQRKVLEVAAEKFGWGKRPQGENGRYYGVAMHESFASHVAQMAEVSVTNGAIKVERVVCVIDCGLAVNPDIVRAQMESGIVFGLSAALLGEITFEDGAARQSNFHDYPVLRMSECPVIEVHIVESSEPPSGVGEPGVPPIAAAVANAVFAATGKRLRELPLRLPTA